MTRERITLTNEEIEDALKNGGKTNKSQSSYLGVCEDVWRRERVRYEESKRMLKEIKLLTERDPKLELTRETDINNFVSSCKSIYSRSRKTIGYNEVTIDLGDDDAVVKLDTDWHIGNEMTNMSLWSEDIKITRETPRLFTILDGDYTDNLGAIKKAGAYESILTVPESKEKVKNAVAMLKDKILGVTQGCHDEWFFNQDSWDISQYLADHCIGYWLGFRARVNIILGEQTYSIYVRHKYKRHSTDNLGWGMLYKFRKLENPVDIMMSGHHHQPHVSVAHERGQKVYMLMGGSYKPYDRFLEHKDIDTSISMMPAVLLRSDKHQITPFLDFKDTLDYI